MRVTRAAGRRQYDHDSGVTDRRPHGARSGGARRTVTITRCLHTAAATALAVLLWGPGSPALASEHASAAPGRTGPHVGQNLSPTRSAGHEVPAVAGPAQKPVLRWSIRLHRTEAASNGEDDASFTLSGSAALSYGSTGPLDYSNSTLQQDSRQVSANVPEGSFGAVGACGQDPPDPFGNCNLASKLVSTQPGTFVVGPVYRSPDGAITQVGLKFGQRPAEVVSATCTGDCGKLPGTIKESLADETLRAIYDPQDKGYFSISGFKKNPDGSVVARQSIIKSQFPNRYSVNATWTTCAQPTVTLPADIRDPDTPQGMADRIPPRKVTPIPVSVDVPSCAGATYLTVVGQSGDGTVQINGQDQFELKPGKYKLRVKLTGDQQTDEQRGPQLVLMAKDDSATPALLAKTNAFAVSAIPIHYTVSFDGAILAEPELGPARGMVVSDSWSSDSGEMQDLDGVYMNEVVGANDNADTTQSGVFWPATAFHYDHHALRLADLAGTPAGAGHLLTSHQALCIIDQRTNPTSLTVPAADSVFPMADSGYSISFSVGKSKTGTATFKTDKHGESVSVTGRVTSTGPTITISSGAGATAPPGGVSLTQDLRSGKVLAH